MVPLDGSAAKVRKLITRLLAIRVMGLILGRRPLADDESPVGVGYEPARYRTPG